MDRPNGRTRWTGPKPNVEQREMPEAGDFSTDVDESNLPYGMGEGGVRPEYGAGLERER